MHELKGEIVTQEQSNRELVEKARNRKDKKY